LLVVAVEPLPESKPLLVVAPLVVVASSLSSSPSHIFFAIVLALLAVELAVEASLRLMSTDRVDKWRLSLPFSIIDFSVIESSFNWADSPLINIVTNSKNLAVAAGLRYVFLLFNPLR